VRRELIDSGAITDPDSPKGKLLAISAHLFREQGYERTTVRDIGGEAGILPGSIFHHFHSKDEILRTVMRETINLNLARMRNSLPEADNAVEELRILIGWELYANHGETGEAWSVMFNEWRSLSAEGQEEILQLRREYDALWIAALNHAQKNGLIALQPRVLRRLLAGALNWTPHWFRPQRGLSLDGLTEEVLKLILVTR
jgi:AcrR family transcriptional regulator